MANRIQNMRMRGKVERGDKKQVSGSLPGATWRRQRSRDGESDRCRRGERARGRGEGARRLAWTEAEGAGLRDFRNGNEPERTGSQREQKRTFCG